MMASTLSGRGRKHALVGEEDVEFSIVRDNPYDAKNNPSGIISLGTADNVFSPTIDKGMGFFF